MPEEDFHLSVMAPLQAHPAMPASGRKGIRNRLLRVFSATSALSA
jgi:hypothetical protein